ncbi:ATP-binding protein [Blastococcus sp. PRF04-17]|uniref:ATP-binding protein n=1 Tax=Blastococcus sp. PRF04-17 TaxID=2933797 RepID=UPI001FF6D521|nr:ATP-binding protein [Blastococcus sp. PRF04-17]UOY03694.1 ATP-binding protein [Blastococcus sp. PRF04-17]
MTSSTPATSVGTTIRPRERDAILQALRAGVVPRVGQQHVQVGRAEEVKALLSDVDRIADGGSAFRLAIGEYGSGKTFFLNLVRSIAMERKLVTVHADLSPDRRLHATGGQARSLYTELMRNIATRAKPDGGAMGSIVERFITAALTEARDTGTTPDAVIRTRLASLSELTGGYDFAEVIGAYWRGHDTGNEQLKSDAVRWLRGEFSTRTDARAALGVRTIVDDANFYDQLKLLARFVVMAGFGGLLVCLDEMVNLYKLANTQARNANYEQILRILNDSLQGTAAHLGFILGGTPDFLLDTRRGLYSYAALQSRLAENTYATGGLVDYSGPVLRLANLTPEDFYLLLTRLRHVFAGGDANAYLIPDDALTAFMTHCSSRIGDAYFRTPRTTIKEFVNLLAVLEQNPGTDWAPLVGAVNLVAESNPDLAPLAEEDGFARPDATEASDGQTEPPVGSSSASASSPENDDLATFRL